jgi:hypothetical protein
LSWRCRERGGEVYFALKGDYDFAPALVTARLGIDPDPREAKGGSKPQDNELGALVGEMEAEVVDVYAMSSQLIKRLAPTAERMKQAMSELGLSAVLQVVLHITVDDAKPTPAIGFDAKTINFLSSVGAFIDVDTYRK